MPSDAFGKVQMDQRWPTNKTANQLRLHAGKEIVPIVVVYTKKVEKKFGGMKLPSLF